MSDSGLSGRRKALGSQCLQALMRERCQVIAKRSSMPSAFFGRYRLMAIDGTVFNTPDTEANAAAFGRSSHQYGPGAYPQVRCVLLAECGSHAVVGLEIDRYDVSEVHGAHRLLEQIGPEMVVLMDAGITSGGFLEHVRERRAHALGALEAGVWEHLSHQRRLADGSVLAWVGPTRPGSAHYPLRRGMWVRIISYRVTDEIKTHERAQRKVLRSKTPEGVRQELYGIYLAHYAVRVPAFASRGGGRAGP